MTILMVCGSGAFYSPTCKLNAVSVMLQVMAHRLSNNPFQRLPLCQRPDPRFSELMFNQTIIVIPRRLTTFVHYKPCAGAETGRKWLRMQYELVLQKLDMTSMSSSTFLPQTPQHVVLIRPP